MRPFLLWLVFLSRLSYRAPNLSLSLHSHSGVSHDNIEVSDVAIDRFLYVIEFRSTHREIATTSRLSIWPESSS
ncbi:hypothetical protein N7453_009471 [Penicillium expansum]|nr:hypothetical protein N7453_009471 [Penicillium expansum]